MWDKKIKIQRKVLLVPENMALRFYFFWEAFE